MLNDDPTVENALEVWDPINIIDDIHTIAIRAAIMAYSIIVAPESSMRLFERIGLDGSTNGFSSGKRVGSGVDTDRVSERTLTQSRVYCPRKLCPRQIRRYAGYDEAEAKNDVSRPPHE